MKQEKRRNVKIPYSVLNFPHIIRIVQSRESQKTEKVPACAKLSQIFRVILVNHENFRKPNFTGHMLVGISIFGIGGSMSCGSHEVGL